MNLNDVIDWLAEIPVICLIGLIWGVALMFVPFVQYIAYKLDCRKYGKEYTDEMYRRM